jgi:acyl-ACP thioesterase
VRLDAIARWLQDVAYADVEDAGLSNRAAWVVRRTRIRVERFPRFREPVTLSTFCSGLGRMWAERRTSIVGAGALVETAALWVHLDPSAQRPVPFDDVETATWAASADGRQVKARLQHPTPPSDAERMPWRFRATDLDLARHVNNAAYWEPLEDQLISGPEDPEVADAEIEFREAAQPGDALVLRRPGSLWITAPDGRLHASIVIGS